jgi:glycine oxidase
MIETRTQLLVLGGGVIGTAIAYECATRGISVTVIEKNETGMESSSAAAGMLGAQVESHFPGAFYELCTQSRTLYADWIERLEAVSGVAVDYRDGGIVRVALTEEDEAELRGRLSWMDGDVRWLNAAEIKELEPELGNGARGGLYFSADHQVNAPKLAQSLRAALRRLRVDVREYTEISEWLVEHQTNAICGVRCGNEQFVAEQTVVAAGAWSAHLLTPLGITLPVKPIKGQCFAVQPARPLTERTVFTKGCYVVPKSDGSLVIGATEEDSGFDKQIDETAVARIQATACQLLPALQNATFSRAWTGLRPGSADGKPFLGPVPGRPNLFIAAGHYRNGILLTPITARLMADLLTTGRTAVDLTPFAVGR